MVKIESRLYNQVSKIAKKQYKNITKKQILLFYQQLYKLIKFSKIFTQNCHNTAIYIQDINASLLTLGIKPTNQQLGGYQNIFNGFCNKEMDKCYLTQTAGYENYDGYCADESSQCKITQTGGYEDYDGYCDDESSQCKVIQTGGYENYDGYCDDESSQCSFQTGGTYDGFCAGEKTQCIPSIGGGKKTKKKHQKKRPSKRLKDYTEKCLFDKDDFNKLSIDFSKLNSQVEAKFTSNSLYYLNAVSKYILDQIVKP